MKHLTDIGIYIAVNAKGTDPLVLGSAVARKLRLHSIDTESLLTAICAAKYFGVDDFLKNEIEKAVLESPEFEKIKEILP